MRNALNLNKAANKTARKAAATWCTTHAPYLAHVYTLHTPHMPLRRKAGILMYERSTQPAIVRSTGRKYTDMIDAVNDIVILHESTTAARKAVARKLWEVRHKMINAGTYSTQNISTLARQFNGRAPHKVQPQYVGIIGLTSDTIPLWVRQAVARLTA